MNQNMPRISGRKRWSVKTGDVAENRLTEKATLQYPHSFCERQQNCQKEQKDIGGVRALNIVSADGRRTLSS